MIADVMKEYKKKKSNFLVNSKIPEKKLSNFKLVLCFKSCIEVKLVARGIMINKNWCVLIFSQMVCQPGHQAVFSSGQLVKLYFINEWLFNGVHFETTLGNQGTLTQGKYK